MGLQAESAGTVPSDHVNPLVVQAMLEVGIDISQKVPRALTQEIVDKADVIVLTDASIKGSFPKNLLGRMRGKLVYWSISDPQGKPIEVVRFVRDQIEKQVVDLAKL